MRARTILAVAGLAGLTIVPRCSTRAYDEGTPPEARTSASLAEASPSAVAVSGESRPPPAAGEVPGRAAPGNGVVSAVPLSEPPPPPADAAADPFRETIRPILSARCGRCHDPGGRMYARLPFDDPKVVSSHSPGVLRRLEGGDRAAMEKWLSGLAPAGGQR